MMILDSGLLFLGHPVYIYRVAIYTGFPKKSKLLPNKQKIVLKPVN